MAEEQKADFGQMVEKPDVAFEEPWHAQLFALTLQLSREGLFSWTEWVGIFSKEIAAASGRAGEDVTAAYYRQWSSALEKILLQRIDLQPERTDLRQEQWRQSYLATPHGAPVELILTTVHEDACTPRREDDSHHHHHHHHHHHSHPHRHPAPVFISPAQKQ